MYKTVFSFLILVDTIKIQTGAIMVIVHGTFSSFISFGIIYPTQMSL